MIYKRRRNENIQYFKPHFYKIHQGIANNENDFAQYNAKCTVPLNFHVLFITIHYLIIIDPIYDFKSGATIYVPKGGPLKNLLGV